MLSQLMDSLVFSLQILRRCNCCAVYLCFRWRNCKRVSSMWAFMQTEYASNMLTFSYFIYFKYINLVVSSLSSLIHFSSFRGMWWPMHMCQTSICKLFFCFVFLIKGVKRHTIHMHTSSEHYVHPGLHTTHANNSLIQTLLKK